MNQTTVRYYRCHDLNDPNLFFFAVWTNYDKENHKARIVEVASINQFNGNVEVYDEGPWEGLIARTFVPDLTEEITQDQFNDIRISYINRKGQA